MQRRSSGIWRRGSPCHKTRSRKTGRWEAVIWAVLLAGFLFAGGVRRAALAAESALPYRYVLEGGGGGETSFSLEEGDIIYIRGTGYYVENVTGQRANLCKIPPQEAELWEQILMAATQAQGMEDSGFRGVAVVLHTHSQESYGETTGERGTIYGVGKAIAEALNARGIKTIHSWAVYSPADNGAYARARRTLVALERYSPDLILDVHREEGAPELRDAARGIRLVVGRDHPRFQENLAFALKLQEKAEETPGFKGLIREVMVVRGVYNQDLIPRALLVLVGNKRTPRVEAIQAGTQFGELLAETLYPGARVVQAQELPKEEAGKSRERTVLALTGGIILLLLVYRYLAHRAASGKGKGNRR